MREVVDSREREGGQRERETERQRGSEERVVWFRVFWGCLDSKISSPSN
jgi:hypothetical protein